MDAFNPIFMMADSGARGNKRRCVSSPGMRGLMADLSGKIIDLPITANFREGLSVSGLLHFLAWCSQGSADMGTAVRLTRWVGILTRRLVDVAQDVIVRRGGLRRLDAEPRPGARTPDAVDVRCTELLNDSRLMGRLLGADVLDPATKEVLFPKDTILDEEKLTTIGEKNAREIMVRGSRCIGSFALECDDYVKWSCPASRMGEASARRRARPSSRR